MKHLLSIETLARADMDRILGGTVALKKERGRHPTQPLTGQIWGMLFSKSSTRTRVSFEVGIRELGGQAIFLASTEIHLGRGEPINDTARVLGRLVHGAVLRTYAQSDVEGQGGVPKAPPDHDPMPLQHLEKPKHPHPPRHNM